jgi:mRNA-degrading endonuclease HigB of HigAB toxin-antitoxin module
MHVISRKRLLEFGAEHPDANQVLDDWYRIAKDAIWKNLSKFKYTLMRISMASIRYLILVATNIDW